MPEGHTLRRIADRLGPALAGRVVTAFESRRPELAVAGRRRGVVGRRVESVQARGKHLLVRFEGGLSLHTHLGLRGSWYLYRIGTPWGIPRTLADVVLEAGDRVAVCVRARHAELLTASEEKEHGALRALGPDALANEVDVGEVLRRLKSRPEEDVGTALLDQTVLAGVGNIYRAEALFACGLHPFARVGNLDDDTLSRLVAAASRLLRAGVMSRQRPTVYGRTGRPCPRCGAPIMSRRHGALKRMAYWCPSCQPETVRG